MLFRKIILVFFCIVKGKVNAILKLPFDFYQLTSKPHYVDKTELIYTFFNEREDWLRCGSQFFYYVTCPRGFGKTTNLRMIQHFAQIELDEMGNRVPKRNTTAYRVFGNLKIAKIPEAIDNHLAEYPVIYLDLNFAADDLVNETTSIHALFKKIQQCYVEYDWLKPCIRNYSLASMMHKVLHGEYGKNIIRRSIHDLASILYGYFNKEVVLLIDDFDSAARMAMEIPQLDVKTLYFLIHEILDKAHHFTSVAKHAFITGVTGVNFRSVAYQHRIVEHCPFLNDHRFSAHFGFDENEVNVVMDKYNCTEDERDKLRKYYKGYKVLNLDRRIYNPLSISQYFISKEQKLSENELLKGYWAIGEKPWFISQFSKAPAFRHKILGLLYNGTFKSVVPIKEYPPMMFYRFIKLRDAYYEGIQKNDINGFLAYFFEVGFLSHAETKFVYEFPNDEIEQEFKKRFRDDRFFTTTTSGGLKRYARAVTEPFDECSDNDDDSDQQSEDNGSVDEKLIWKKKDKIKVDQPDPKKTTVGNFTTTTLNRKNRHLYTYNGPGHREAKLITLRTLTKFGPTTSTRSRVGLRALNWLEAKLSTRPTRFPIKKWY